MNETETFVKTLVDMLEAQRIVIAEVIKRLERIENSIDRKKILALTAVSELKEKVSKLEAGGTRTPIPEDVNKRLGEIEDKINEIKTSKPDETVSSSAIDEVTIRIGKMERVIEEWQREYDERFEELQTIEKSIPTGELISRVGTMETILENKEKEYGKKIGEIETLKKDVDIISKELIEIKKITMELAKLMGNIETKPV